MRRDIEKTTESGGSCKSGGSPQRENVSRDGDARASARSTGETSVAGAAHCRAGDTVADRTDQSNDGRARKERVDSDSGADVEQRLKKRKRQEIQRLEPHEQRQVLELRQVWALWA